ncbi:MAG: nucleoside-diphosphate kinase [Candidatus Brocadiae bacterium]|nr:nucleoside-diphosphate kinase [Candidatus Brocadiia bacterium]
MERTLVLLKPDALQRGLVGQILKRFEEKGMKIAGMKMMQMTQEIAARHYRAHVEKGFYPSLVKFMTSSPIIALAIEGVGAVHVCRKMTGATFGLKAEPGTIRGDYGVSTSFNLIHSSEDKESAAWELPIFFKEEELFGYSKALDGWVSCEEDLKKAASL